MSAVVQKSEIWSERLKKIAYALISIANISVAVIVGAGVITASGPISFIIMGVSAVTSFCLFLLGVKQKDLEKYLNLYDKIIEGLEKNGRAEIKMDEILTLISDINSNISATPKVTSREIASAPYGNIEINNNRIPIIVYKDKHTGEIVYELQNVETPRINIDD